MKIPKQLLYEIIDFDKTELINRLEYPVKLRNWVYKNYKQEDYFNGASYICHSAGYYYELQENGWLYKERKAICNGCKAETIKYVCSKRFRQIYCFDCWFDCENTFI